jgi:glycerophosphoryl diester phosphodiesterase
MISIAHRGIPALRPENSIGGFRKAISFNCNYVELDVRKTKDDVVVVMHDSKVNRTTDGRGKVKHHTYSELEKYVIRGTDERIPRLDEVIYEFEGKTKFDVEIKSTDTASLVVDIIRDFVGKGVPYEDFLVTSFKWKELNEVKKLDPNVPIGVIPTIRASSAVRFAIANGFEHVVLHHRQISSGIMKFAKANGLTVFTYTVNDVKDICRMMSMGVDGIVTDDVRNLI